MWTCDPAMTATVVDSFQAAGPLFVQSLQAILAAHCALVGEHNWPTDATQAVLEDPNYDFIVVGAGSAGSVVANRLSEIPDWKVLLIEAGGDPTLANELPKLFHNNIKTEGDWKYKPEPQKGFCRGHKNNRCAWPRGKVLGGCSSTNAMFYVRGNKLDYDEWAAKGNEGWSYEDILPYFKKSENYSRPLTEETQKYHSRDGYLHVQDDDDMEIIEKIIMQAVNELGIETTDINGPSQMGVAKSQTTTKYGVRQSTARAFLSPIKDRKNFHVMKNAHVTKLLFKPNTNVVEGVHLIKNGKEITIKAKKEVIISAGAINTPQLLLLSGIGPSQQLQKIYIDVKADLPVGENLQDHVFATFFYTMPGNKNITSPENIAKELVSYLLTNKGVLSGITPHRVISFYNTTDKSAVSPDVQFHYLVFPTRLHNLVDVWDKHDMNDEVKDEFRKLNEDNVVVVIYAVLLRPKSKGKIVLKSKDPNEHPLIYANYFDDPEDWTVLLKGIKEHAIKLGETNVFKKVGLKLDWLKVKECEHYDKASDDFLECFSRVMTLSLYHPVGTAKMGPKTDTSAVVDPELRVHNIQRLRVIDASVMPDIVRGNTNAPTIMIAEKGADLIKKTWWKGHTEL